MTDDIKQLLLEKATRAMQNAYAPFSTFRVGAAVLTERGNMYTGCNVENVSYGLSMCAERAAVFTAVTAEGQEMKLAIIAVVAENSRPCSPCGACRQVIAEFGHHAHIIFTGMDGREEVAIYDLLPKAFTLS
jgi:cytidine deaminase